MAGRRKKPIVAATVASDSVQSSFSRRKISSVSVLRIVRRRFLEEITLPKIRLVVADDHRGMVEAVCGMLDEDFEVLGSVQNGEQAVDAVVSLNPDALIIDISMPVLNGLQAAKQLQRSQCQAKVIFLTVHESPEFLDAAFSAGASAYVTKGRLSIDLIPAIREAMAGHVFVSNPGGKLPVKSSLPI
jgi:CheY-like chemotaxis protein